MNDSIKDAPGWPGIEPRWTSSAKVGIGTAFNATSRVWFTLSHGILNEIYYPRIDRACTRDFGMIVTDGKEFFSEEKRQALHHVSYTSPGAPAYRLLNTCVAGRYRIEKEVIADPQRAVVLQRTRFVPLVGVLADYHLFALLAPHIGNKGYGNTAWTGDYKGTPMLFAERDGTTLALACSGPWLNLSVDFAGASDGWHDLMAHKQITETHARAANGNVALIGEIDLHQTAGEFVLAVGFGRTAAEAGHHSLASLRDGFDAACTTYVDEWRGWQRKLLTLDAATAIGHPQPGKQNVTNDQTVSGEPNLYRVSTAVMRAHEAKTFPGGTIASLSLPWGFAKGDDDLGGYHLVWPRDMAETAGALLAAGAREDAWRAIRYLEVTQETDGHWAQNMWLDGTPYWSGVQMDETALPVLLVDLARREGALEGDQTVRLWPMVRRAAGYLVRNGPVTQQDRWEEDPGYSPFTLAAEVAALLAAAEIADSYQEAAVAVYLRETADAWNAEIETWTYVTDTALAREMGVDGYYVRIAPPDKADAASPKYGFVPIKNRPAEQSNEPATHIISPDALALVRFGLRAADDQRIVNTVKVIDALLKVETPAGPAWHRYNDDGYGEHEDGSPFDGTGVGRPWPLLTGERAHYELAAGRHDEASRLLRVLEAFANEGGLVSEQVWDSPDLPERELFFGKPSGSAMPLVWAHAEHVKLLRSLRDKRVFDTPPQPVERYQLKQTDSPFAVWRFNHKCRNMRAGKTLRIETLAPARIHWSIDGWNTPHDSEATDTGLGVFVTDVPTGALPAGASVVFTFYWTEAGRWEQVDFGVEVANVSSLSKGW